MRQRSEGSQGRGGSIGGNPGRDDGGQGGGGGGPEQGRLVRRIAPVRHPAPFVPNRPFVKSPIGPIRFAE